jgi:putative membrane protein
VTGAGGDPGGVPPEPTPFGAPVDPAVDVPWRRLDARMIAVDVTRLAGSLVPLGVAVVLRNADAGAVASTLTTLALIGVVSALFDLLRWATTWYRITGDRVEIRTGLVTRRHRSIPRDRIRRVDATAKLLHRAFSLEVVTIATGEQGGSSDDELKLDAVTSPDAAALRDRLLTRRSDSPRTAMTDSPGRPDSNDAPPDTEVGSGEAGDVLAKLNWRWAPYDLLSFWTLAIPALALGGLLQALQSVGVTPDEVANDERVTGRIGDLSLVTGTALAVTAIVLVGVVGAAALFVETWWGFRLVREPGGRLRVRRGLLTTRSISLDEARLRGVELAEPLLLRAAGGARLRAVTTGLAGAEGSRGESADVLLPPVPMGEAQRVSAAVLDESVPPTDRPDLHPHPRGARRRRLTRALVAGAAAWGLVVGAHGATDGVPPAAWAVPAGATVGAVSYALDAYHSLGHALAGRYLVVRRGSLARRTVALQRTGVIGWTVRRTVFQRRLGLATVVVTTAAGHGSYPLVDVDAGDGLGFADEAVPGLLRPFLSDPFAGAGPTGSTGPPTVTT